jgi:hypothetical protein
MSKLEDLYEGKKRFERIGYKLTPKQLQDLDELEETFILSEVLPAISKDIEPRLSTIQARLGAGSGVSPWRTNQRSPES